MSSKNTHVINIDAVKKAIKEKDPDKKVNNVSIGNAIGVGPQVLSDWNSENKSTPKWAVYILNLCELSGLTIQELITKISNEKE